MPTQTLRLPARRDCLAQARDFVLPMAPEALRERVDLVLEELFLNVADYAYAAMRDNGQERPSQAAAPGNAPGNPPGNAPEVALTCDSRDDGGFILQVTDWGEPFDPLRQPPPDIAAPLDEREPGGLGIHLVKSLTSELRYQREGDANRLECLFGPVTPAD